MAGLMSSPTLTIILKHLNRELVKTLDEDPGSIESIDFPFNVQSFCTEMDRELELLSAYRTIYNLDRNHK